MNEQNPSFTPLNCNPHHELLATLQASLAQCSDGGRDRLFETREQLGDLTRRIEDGPWGVLSSLTNALQVMFGHLLRRGNLAGPDAMHLASEIISFVDSALTLSPPDGGNVVQQATPETLPLTGSGVMDGLKLALAPNATSPDEGASADGKTLEIQSGERVDDDADTTVASMRRAPGERPSRPELGTVAYQMVNESRLGELLIKMGCIESAQLDRALVLQKLSRKRLGDVLMAMEAIDMASLQAALEVQRQETLRFMDNRTSGGNGRTISEAS